MTNNSVEYALSLTRESLALRALRVQTRDLKNAHMICGPQVGQFLAVLAQSIQAKTIFEVGCFIGYSTLSMAQACPTAHIYTCDLSPGPISIARKATQDYNVTIFEMDALLALQKVPGPIDFAFIDGNKGSYPVYFDAILPRMRPGGIMVFDNCLWKGKAQNPPDEASFGIARANRNIAESPHVSSSFITIGDGLHVALVHDIPREQRDGLLATVGTSLYS